MTRQALCHELEVRVACRHIQRIVWLVAAFTLSCIRETDLRIRQGDDLNLKGQYLSCHVLEVFGRRKGVPKP